MSSRVAVLGAGAGGLKTANRLAWQAASGADLDVVLVDRAADHVFAPGFVPVFFGEAEPGAFRRPIADLAHPAVRVVTGEVTGLDPAGHAVSGSFGELPYDTLVLALGAEVGAWVAVGTGLGVAFVPSANAGSAPASTAVHASAMALRPVRRMNRSPSSVRPVVDRRAV